MSADTSAHLPRPSEELGEYEVAAGVRALVEQGLKLSTILEMLVETIADESHWKSRAERAERALCVHLDTSLGDLLLGFEVGDEFE